ncbi:MAG: 5-formyltetrahydrofolate cyclo-ligase [Acidobacteria bacterium]|nr:5-formyltetrahydrofolate cyclo-ligase [Acidobacteriota bacterium]
MTTTKRELRKIYLAKRAALGAAELKEKSLRVAERFFDAFDLEKIDYLHSFLPIARFNELDTRLILHRVWFGHSHIETLVPRVDFERGELENLKFTPVTELVENAWMIHEPSHDETVESAKLDLVLVPLLCFDLEGFRVGYGKGFYDKLLANCRADCVKVGLSGFPPVEKIADVDEYDIRMDFVVTPDELYRFD